MRIVVQRVRSASVSVAGREIARIVALVGFSAQESALQEALARLAKRLVALRIFDEESGRLNRSLQDVQGELLLIPQITLTASLEKGTRPSFHTAAPPDIANAMFVSFVKEVNVLYPRVSTGMFQSDMVVTLENDGPVTFVLDSS